VDERVLGDAGQAEVLKHEFFDLAGTMSSKIPKSKTSMYRREHEELFRSIRAGQPINNGHYMCNSTMMAIMGRLAAYTGKTLTWEQCQASTERLGPTEYAWGDAPEPVVPIPGKTKLV
ncbi:gfo/Idh/MocA family oxidoreductase, partial [Pirellulales bacterium]|nr:gfo/Idh/MocA family oxidoreductase [Pirellulales bacterium]